VIAVFEQQKLDGPGCFARQPLRMLPCTILSSFPATMKSGQVIFDATPFSVRPVP
jgi:hypothetical protein